MGTFNLLTLNKLRLVALGCLLAACGSSSSPCPTGNCNNYSTQEKAQIAFDADKNCLSNLDPDHNGKACEQLPSASTGTTTGTGTTSGTGATTGTGSTSNCPSTSNCGCSNKTKSSCSGPCCKWVTGTGCVCN